MHQRIGGWEQCWTFLKLRSIYSLNAVPGLNWKNVANAMQTQNWNCILFSSRTANFVFWQLRLFSWSEYVSVLKSFQTLQVWFGELIFGLKIDWQLSLWFCIMEFDSPFVFVFQNAFLVALKANPIYWKENGNWCK